MMELGWNYDKEQDNLAADIKEAERERIILQGIINLRECQQSETFIIEVLMAFFSMEEEEASEFYERALAYEKEVIL